MRFENKVAIVTGGASGIGEATSHVFAREGAAVVVVDLNDPSHVVSAIEAAGGRAVGVQGSVTSAEVLQKAIDSAVEGFGQLDILINNAGFGIPSPIEECSEDLWDQTFDVNVKGGFLASKLALPHLRKTRGTILFTSSIAGIQPGCNVAAYSATKGAVINLAKCMALDHAPEGIRVNVVCPGATDTAILRVGLGSDDVSIAAKQLPLLRVVEPEEIGEAFAYLASDHARSITGQTLIVDGGYSAGDFRMLPSVFKK